MRLVRHCQCAAPEKGRPLPNACTLGATFRYTKVIKSPMDLKTMLNKCKQVNEQRPYTRLSDYEAHLALIVSNCNEFNTKYDRHLYLEPLAKQLQEAGLAQLKQKREELEALENTLMGEQTQVVVPLERKIREQKPRDRAAEKERRKELGAMGAKRRKHLGGAAAAAAAANLEQAPALTVDEPEAVAIDFLQAETSIFRSSGSAEVSSCASAPLDSRANTVLNGAKSEGAGRGTSNGAETEMGEPMSDIEDELAQSFDDEGSEVQREMRGGGAASAMSNQTRWSADQGSAGESPLGDYESPEGSLAGSLGGFLAASDDDNASEMDAISEMSDLSSAVPFSPSASSINDGESEMEDDWTSDVDYEQVWPSFFLVVGGHARFVVARREALIGNLLEACRLDSLDRFRPTRALVSV